MKRISLLPIIIIVLGGLAGNALRFTEKLPDRMADFSEVPLIINNTYFGREYPISEATAEVLQASVSTDRIYTTEDGKLFQLFIAYFESQKYGSQIHSPKHCLPGSGWKIERIEPYKLILPDGDSRIINYAVIRDRIRKAVMFYWYESRSGSIRGEYALKFDLIRNSLLFEPGDAAIIRLTVDIGNDVEQSTEYGIKFLSTLFPYIKASLPF